jgi:hypothetical protein
LEKQVDLKLSTLRNPRKNADVRRIFACADGAADVTAEGGT